MLKREGGVFEDTIPLQCVNSGGIGAGPTGTATSPTVEQTEGLPSPSPAPLAMHKGYK